MRTVSGTSSARSATHFCATKVPTIDASDRDQTAVVGPGVDESYHHRVVQPLRQPRRGFRGGDLEIRCGRTVPQCPVQFRYVKSRSDLESLTYAKSTNPTLTRQGCM